MIRVANDWQPHTECTEHVQASRHSANNYMSQMCIGCYRCPHQLVCALEQGLHHVPIGVSSTVALLIRHNVAAWASNCTRFVIAKSGGKAWVHAKRANNQVEVLLLQRHCITVAVYAVHVLVHVLVFLLAMHGPCTQQGG